MRSKPKIDIVRKKQILDKLWYINAYVGLSVKNRLALHEIIQDIMKR